MILFIYLLLLFFRSCKPKWRALKLGETAVLGMLLEINFIP